MEPVVGEPQIASEIMTIDAARCSMNPPLLFQLSDDVILELSELYVSDTAAVLHLSDAENVGEEAGLIKLHYVSDSGQGSSEFSSGMKRLLGSILYIVRDYLDQLGLKVPVFCLVSASDDKRLKCHVDRLASDQDWSRGEFAVLFASKIDAEDVISSIVLGLPLNQLGSSIEPISPGAFSDHVRREARSGTLSEDHRELVRVIADCITENSQPEGRIDDWVQARLEDIKKGVGVRIR